MITRALVPALPATLEEESRLRHRDLEELSDEELEAERILVTLDIAQRTFQRTRPRVIDRSLPGLEVMTDLKWLEERRCRLKLEQARRGRNGRTS